MWLSHHARFFDPVDFVEMIFKSDEFQTLHRLSKLIPDPPGHYHSPVVDPFQLEREGFSIDRNVPAGILAARKYRIGRHGSTLEPGTSVLEVVSFS